MVDTGANYEMIGKKMATQMDLQGSDLIEGITYITVEGEIHKSRCVSKRQVAIALKPGKLYEAKVYLHVMADNATTYDALLGAQWIHRIEGKHHQYKIFPPEFHA